MTQETSIYDDEAFRLETIEVVKSAIGVLSDFSHSQPSLKQFPELGSGYFLFADNCIFDMPEDEAQCTIDNRPDYAKDDPGEICINAVAVADNVVRRTVLQYSVKMAESIEMERSQTVKDVHLMKEVDDIVVDVFQDLYKDMHEGVSN